MRSMDEAKDEELNKELTKHVKEAIDSADKAPFPKPEDTLLHVYADSEGEGQ